MMQEQGKPPQLIVCFLPRKPMDAYGDVRLLFSSSPRLTAGAGRRSSRRRSLTSAPSPARRSSASATSRSASRRSASSSPSASRATTSTSATSRSRSTSRCRAASTRSSSPRTSALSLNALRCVSFARSRARGSERDSADAVSVVPRSQMVRFEILLPPHPLRPARSCGRASPPHAQVHRANGVLMPISRRSSAATSRTRRPARSRLRSPRSSVPWTTRAASTVQQSRCSLVRPSASLPRSPPSFD